MKISILTLFPEMFTGPFDHSIIKNAKNQNILSIDFVNIRDFGLGLHKTVDDTAYGGGRGMVMRADVLSDAINATKNTVFKKEKVILLDARGQTFTQSTAKHFSKLDHMILICGHYEGVDERVRSLIDETISIGDFILTGGEIPAMLITDAISRLIPGTLENDATENESFSLFGDDMSKHLEYPQYTKPRSFNGEDVPEILLSGNHAKIAEWRKDQSLQITKKHRPDLLVKKEIQKKS